VARLKVAALIIGPIGVGLIGLYLNFVTSVATLIGLGLNASAVREIAAANSAGRVALLSSSLRALVSVTAIAAIVAAIGLLTFRAPVARTFLDAGMAEDIPWLTLAAILLAMTTVCLVLLNGFRQIASLSLMQVSGAVLGTLTGLALLYGWREEGILSYVVAVQAGGLLAGIVFASRLPWPKTPFRPRIVISQAGAMVTQGLSFMVSTFALSFAVLTIRSMIGGRLGGVALGQFAGAWVISSTYVSFILQAMGTDFYPRLSESAGDRHTYLRLISEQVETAVLLATPVLILTIAFAPWILQFAYSSAFKDAASLLRWQVLGDFFKIISWTLAMSLLATSRSKTYLAVEISAAAIFVIFVWFGIERFGLEVAGIGYFAMYALYLVLLLAVTGVRFEASALKAISVCGVLSTIVFLASMISEASGMAVGTIAFGLMTNWLYRRLNELGALPSILRLR
jgi:O-antigen/teichoic acid export membrane protein